MKLLDLEPEFLYYTGEDDKIMHVGDPPDVPMEKADAIMFICPKCAHPAELGVGGHRVICNRPRVPVIEGKYVGPGRWEFSGTGFHDLTLTGVNSEGKSSVQLNGGCAAHFHITNGEVIPC